MSTVAPGGQPGVHLRLPPAEDLAGIIVVVLIAASASASAAYAGYGAVQGLMSSGEVRHLSVLAVAGVVGFLGNELVAQYRIRTGRRMGSAALVVDACTPH